MYCPYCGELLNEACDYCFECGEEAYEAQQTKKRKDAKVRAGRDAKRLLRRLNSRSVSLVM